MPLKTASEVRKIGWEALVERLGVAGATLFLLEYEQGHGDYTKERKKWIDGKKLEEIVKSIRKRKKRK